MESTIGTSGSQDTDAATSQGKESSVQWLDLLYGHTELQESEGAEADLHKHRSNCTKNPGHVDFIPVAAFNLQHLPDGHRDQDLLDVIKAEADLTVRVDVKLTSPQRQEFWPDSKAPYPYFDLRGSTCTRMGSGRIREIVSYNNGRSQYGDMHELNVTSCTCRRCQGSSTPKIVWWEIVIWTARHVVYDEAEADHTSFRLFYDEDNCPEVILDKVTLGQVFQKEDWSLLRCVTCDDILAAKLCSMIERCNELRDKVYTKYRRTRDEDKLAFIVSHPHGCPKQITIGRWMAKIREDDSHSFITKFTYNVSTCPGSSGAQVNILGYSWKWVDHVHSGALSGLNYSATGLVK
uniref:Uncharacterized protein n=1 Tax=Biomphalaria glabrata TaxID=6526 RepID=A0A2C9LEH8_BIOGL